MEQREQPTEVGPKQKVEKQVDEAVESFRQLREKERWNC